MEIAILILLSIAVLLLSGLCAFALKNKKGKGENVQAALREEEARTRDFIRESTRLSGETLMAGLKLHTESVEKNIMTIANMEQNRTQDFSRQMDAITKDMEYKIDKLRQEIQETLSQVRTDNERQLEKMRRTVDEKLSETLDTRLTQSLSMVGERIDAVQKAFTEIQTLASGVSDLKKVFTNVKTRGIWGEVSLENLLDQVLTKDQYKAFESVDDGAKRVDFGILLPGKKGEKVVLPIDSKFPLEDYQRLVEAAENADALIVEAASRALEARIKQEAKDISQKYIQPPRTTDFGILYLPIEGLYAEVTKKSGLLEELQRKYRIMVCGPSTLGAFLNSLQMGFKTLAIEKRSSEIWKLLAVFKKDFSKFGELLSKTQKKVREVADSIENANKRTELIQTRLSKVELLSDADDERLPAAAVDGFDDDDDFKF